MAAETESAQTASSGQAPVTVTFDRATTELDAIQRAVYALADLMTVDIRALDHEFACVLHPRRGEPDREELRHRMRAEVNDQTLRLRIGRETEPLRNLIFALAFSETGLAGAEGPSA